MSEGIKNLVNKTILLGLTFYFLVFGLVVEKAVEVESLEPFGINVGVYVALTIISEAILTITLVWIFSVERSAWPPYAEKAISSFKSWNPVNWFAGIYLAVKSAWNLSLIDLSLNSRLTVWLGRLNRTFAALPFFYLLIVGWTGLSKIAFILVTLDLLITLGLWFVMEVYTVNVDLRVPFFKKTRGARTFDRAAKMKISAGPALLSESGQIGLIEELAWGEGHARSIEVYEERIRSFPEGVIVARNPNGRVLAVAMGTPCDGPEILRRTSVTFDSIANKFGHNKTGPDFWGVTLSIPRRYQIIGAGTALLAEVLRLFLIRYRDLLIGSRLPDYEKISALYKENGFDPLTPEDYSNLTVGEARKFLGEKWANGRKDQEWVDTELEYYRGLDFTIVRVEPDYYLKDNPPTGVILKRHNPIYIVPKPFRWVLISLLGDFIIKKALYN